MVATTTRRIGWFITPVLQGFGGNSRKFHNFITYLRATTSRHSPTRNCFGAIAPAGAPTQEEAQQYIHLAHGLEKARLTRLCIPLSNTLVLSTGVTFCLFAISRLLTLGFQS